MGGGRGLVLVASLASLVLGGTQAQAAAQHCVVVPTPPKHGQALLLGAQASSEPVATSNIEVTVPTLKCTGRPTKPIRGSGGGAGSGSGTGGGLPFTGFDLEHALSDGLLLLVLGGLAMYAGAGLRRTLEV